MKIKKSIDLKSGLIRGTPAYVVAIFGLLALLIFSILSAVTIGPIKYTISQVYRIIFYECFGLGNGAELGSGSLHDIVWLVRLPRIVLAVAVGMGLSVSGSVMQAIVRNPLADPYILGISSGATLGATMAVLLGVGAAFGYNSVGICAFFGALIVTLLVQFIANIDGRANSIRLLLGGMALSAVCSSLSNLIIYLAEDKDGIQTITFWLMGGLGGAKWENITVIFPVMLAVTAFFISQSRTLNLMLLGDEAAITLGTDLPRYRHLYLILSALMVGLSVYCAGMIGFVGLIIPHIVRMLFGTDHLRLVPIAALLGAIFLIWADVACRIVLPGSELPVGILISAIGAPCFIYLLVRRSYGFGGGS